MQAVENSLKNKKARAEGVVNIAFKSLKIADK